MIIPHRPENLSYPLGNLEHWVKSTIFAPALRQGHYPSFMKLDQRRDGRVVECGGLEIRCTARYRGFESLSLRNKGCKSMCYVIYTLFCTQETA